MHGEYKTPGGKLVVVDCDVAGDCLVNVRVSGDFFLYPEEALAAINAALEGVPADYPELQIIDRITQALPPGTEMLGFSPDAVARAVRHARRNAVLNAWRGRGWHLLPEVALPPAVNLALDEVLTHQVAIGRRGPTLRFWGWAEEAVVIGRFQSVQNEVDLDEAARRGVRVVRRMS